MLRKASAPKRCSFVLLTHCIPHHEFILGHHLRQSNPLRMIVSKREQASARLEWRN
jgi:hypothetical protein